MHRGFESARSAPGLLSYLLLLALVVVVVGSLAGEALSC
jgi:hypothetical protein